jgi:tyrosine-protein kinase Etk/Wzc
MTDGTYANFDSEDSIDIKAFLLKCIRHWHYFAFFLIVAVLIALLINRYTTPVYKVTTFLLIRDEENPLDPQNFVGASLYGNPYKLENEIGLLRSKDLTKRALRELNFYISYYREDRFKKTELYNGSPFIIDIDSLFEQPLGVDFNLDFLNDTLMSIQATAKEVPGHNFFTNANTRLISSFEFADTVSFGDLIGNQYCRFRILPNFEMMKQVGDHKKYSFQFNSLGQLIGRFRISEIEASKNSSILQISVRCNNVQQGVDYLNKLTEVFLAKGIERDDRIATSTISFIDDQLKGITDSLRYSEDKLQRFRTARGITNIDFQAQQTYQQMEDLQDQQAELIVKSKYYNYLKEYLLKNNQVDDLIAPSSMDISDPLLNNLIIELTRLYAERTEMSFNSIKDNPYLGSLEVKIADTKAKLLENIDNIINTSNISLQEIDGRIAGIESTINKLPESQRELLIIERKFKLNDAIYTFLLTKRSEVQISKASNIPSNEVLDRATPDDFVQVAPNPRMNYIVALLLGVFLPAALIYLRDFFRNKIMDKKDIQAVCDVPVIGNIIHNTHKTSLVVNELPSSLISESFRSLRTNFQFFTNGDGKHVVLVTSIIKGEGKSFTSVNLGTVFAQNQKRVVVIDFDLRKAKLKQYLGIESEEGLSRYLSNNSALEPIIFPSGIGNLDVIPSGPIPPNPSELISSEKTTVLFEELKNRYDVILIDSPPIALVSDALLLLRFADIRILVVRQNFTPKTLFASIMSDLEKRDIKSLNIIINDEKIGLNGYGYGYGYGNGYGYGYGYGYGHEPVRSSFKSFMFRIFLRR